MTLVIRTVRLQLLARSGAVLPGARVRAQLTDYQVDGTDVVPLTWEFAEDYAAPGYYVAALWPNTRGSGGTQYLITADSGELRMQSQLHTIQDGASSVAIRMMVNPPPWPATYQAAHAVEAARVFSDASAQSASLALQANADGSAAAAAVLAFNQRNYPGKYDTDPVSRPSGYGGGPCQIGDSAQVLFEGAYVQKIFNGAIWFVPNVDGQALARPSGSSRVGFLQSGAASQARSTEQKLREVCFSPGDKGALGNAQQDDTSALLAALADQRSLSLVDGIYLATPSSSGAVAALAAHGAHIAGPGTLKVRAGQYYKGTPGAEDNYAFLKLGGDGALALGFRFDGNGQATLAPHNAAGPNVQFFPVLLYGEGAGQKAVLIDTVGSGGHAIEAFYGRRKIVALNTVEGHNGAVVNGVTSTLLALSISENATDSHFNFGHNSAGVAVGLVGKGNDRNGGGIDIDGGDDIVLASSVFRDGQSFGVWPREGAQAGARRLNRLLISGILSHNNCNYARDIQAEFMLGNPDDPNAVPGVDWVVTGCFLIPLDTPPGAGYNAAVFIHRLLERAAVIGNVFSGDLVVPGAKVYAVVYDGAKDVVIRNNVSLIPDAEVILNSPPRGFVSFEGNTNLEVSIDSPYVPTQMRAGGGMWDYGIRRKLPKSGMTFVVINFLGGFCHDVIELVLAGEGDTGTRRQTIVLRGAGGQVPVWLNEGDASDVKVHGTAPPGVSVALGVGTAVIGGFTHALAAANNLIVGIRINVTTPYSNVARFVPKMTY